MSTATLCASPLRSFQISAAASPDAATLTCAAAATRNDDGSNGSSPVSVTASSAAGSPPADVQTSARTSSGIFAGVFPGLCIVVTLAWLSNSVLLVQELHGCNRSPEGGRAHLRLNGARQVGTLALCPPY